MSKPVCTRDGLLRVALCQDGCGLRPVCWLVPAEDCVGLCDLCGEPTCDCDGCLWDACVEDN